MSGESQATTEAHRQKIVELGYLNEEQLLDHLATYYEAGAPGEFPIFLYQRGLLGRGQLKQLGLQPPRGQTTVLGPSKLGQVYSGCKIDRKLGQGGMGTVYLAERESDGQQVVLKFLAPEKALRASIRRRFKREAEVLMKVSGHPNVVDVYGVEGDGPEPHIVMEYVQGQSIDGLLKDRWSLPAEEATKLAQDAALGLAAVHSEGIIHRDVKPANLLIVPGGGLKIVDFGLAKDLEADGITRPGQLVGTPTYMAPEQWGDHEVDGRCDVWSLGATLYHMLVGEPPFSGRNHTEVARKILKGNYTPPRKIEPSIPEDLELVVMQMLMTDRPYRYRDATQCAKDLGRILAGETIQVPRLVEVETGKRHPLLPKLTFILGRDDDCEVTVKHPSISRQHARVQRETTGSTLTDLGSTYGTFVGEMRVQRVNLKHGDTITLGKVALRYHDEGLRRRSTRVAGPAASACQTSKVPDPVLEALAEREDRRAVLHLLERLSPTPLRDRTTAALETLFTPAEQGEIRKALSKRIRAARARVPIRLLGITKEDLGEDPEPWLLWWDQAQHQLPDQLVCDRPLPAARLRIVSGEPALQTVPLDSGNVFAIGRSETCQARLTNRSVSRVHATIVRYHQRFVLRDQGSRFGTDLNGRVTKMAFLDPGDMIRLGKVECAFEVQPPSEKVPRAGLKTYLVDPELFDALLDLKHPAVATALVSALHDVSKLGWVPTVARALDPEHAEELANAIRRHYTERARQARTLLPGLLGAEGNMTVAEWRQLLAERRAELPPQVLSFGWTPSR
jgi:serine/threonine protein kinase